MDPDAPARLAQGHVARLLADPATRVVLVHRGLVAVTDSGGALDLVGPESLPSQPPVPPFYLGRDADAAYLACVLSDSPGDERDFAERPSVSRAPGSLRSWASLRAVGASLGDRDAGLAASAVALAAWHARHPRCPRCGELTKVVQAGWARRCPRDDTLHYPRTDPAVIVAVTDDGGRLLLAHAATWPERRFSLVAGYVEPGESLEAAVRREVAEECGLRLGRLAYAGSQPWPFPASLMLAFRARASGGGLRVDNSEITEAMFVDRDALHALVVSGDILLPPHSSIARALIEDWYGEPLPGE